MDTNSLQTELDELEQRIYEILGEQDDDYISDLVYCLSRLRELDRLISEAIEEIDIKNQELLNQVSRFRGNSNARGNN